MTTTTVYVSPRGDDRQDGTRARPFATLERAVAACRNAGARGARIRLSGGNYFAVSVALTAEDSGLTIEPVDNEAPMLYGGRPITAWRPDGDRFYVADLPGVREGTWDFRSLMVNGRYCPRARWPHEGLLQHESVFRVNWMSSTKGGWERPPTEEELTTLRVHAADVPATLEPRNAEITLYHLWDESMVGVRSVDRATGLVRFSMKAGHPAGAFGGGTEKTRQYVIWNIREGLSRPGQWCLDRVAGQLVYWPLPDEEMASAMVVAPASTAVLRFTGKKERPVRDVTLSGLTLGVTTTPLVAGGFGARAFEGAIEGAHVENIRLERLTVEHAAGQGVRFRESTSVSCEACEIRECGAGGLHIEGRAACITENHIHHVGLTYPSALALRCGGDDHVIAHNEIHHTSYSALNSGGRNIRIEHNLFHHAMEVLADGAAIYMFAAKHCLVRGNHTHSLRDGIVHAYYLDEQSEDSVVEGNLAVNVSWPLHMHMASRCTIRGNVCVNEGNMKVTLANCDGFRIERNVLACKGKLSLLPSYTGIAHLNNNVFHSAAGDVEISMHDRLPSLERNTGPVPVLPDTAGTVIADPRFADAEHGDFRFLPGSPAAAAGIQPIDVGGAGRHNPGLTPQNHARAARSRAPG